MMADKFIFGVDLDGVCGDFYGKLREIAAEWKGIRREDLPVDVSYGLPEWKLDELGGYEPLHRFAVTQRNLFLELPAMAGVRPALRRLSVKGVHIRIITHRLFIKYFHKQAVAQTIEWLDKQGIPYWDLCFLKEKGDVGADLYIDDAPHNVERLRALGKKTIVFTNSTNRNIDGPRCNTWTEVEDYVTREFDLWTKARG
ncbi:MAG: 5'-nucleotidase [Lentisphaeria bacterium]